MPSIDILIPICVIAFPSISIVSCLWLLFSFLYSSTKPLGLKMISLLAISDLLFHSGSLIIFWTDTTTSVSIVSTVITNLAIRFDSLWASCIALFLAKSALCDDQSESKAEWNLVPFIIGSITIDIA